MIVKKLIAMTDFDKAMHALDELDIVLFKESPNLKQELLEEYNQKLIVIQAEEDRLSTEIDTFASIKFPQKLINAIARNIKKRAELETFISELTGSTAGDTPAKPKETEGRAVIVPGTDSEEPPPVVSLRQEVLRQAQVPVVLPLGSPDEMRREIELTLYRGMLGEKELPGMANLTRSTIFVIRNNLVEKIQEPDDAHRDALARPIFVENIGNVHFRMFIPENLDLQNLPKQGSRLAGHSVEGDYSRSHGTGRNDCLIASCRAHTGVNARLQGINNGQIRQYLAHCVTQLDPAFFVAGRQAPEANIKIEFSNYEAIPFGFQGPVSIRTEDTLTEGELRFINNETKPVGMFAYTDGQGRFEYTFDENGVYLSFTQTHTRNENGVLMEISADGLDLFIAQAINKGMDNPPAILVY